MEAKYLINFIKIQRMRKLFYAFLFAAVALIGGCTPDDNIPEVDLEGGYNGFEMNDCEVYYRGDFYGDGQDNYVVFFGHKDKEGEYTRRVAFEITPSEVSEDKVPLGTYSVSAGNMKPGNADQLLTGSYYIRDTESAFTMLIKDATLTISYNGEKKSYLMEASVGGDYNINVEEEETEDTEEGEESEDEEEEEEVVEPDKIVDIECRFEGMPVMSGLDVSGKFVNITPFLYEVSYDEVEVASGKTMAEWTFAAYDLNCYMYTMYMMAYEYGDKAMMEQFQNFQIPAYGSYFVIYTEIPERENGEPLVLPMGRFQVDGFNTGYLGTALGATALVVTNGAEGLEEVEDAAYDGLVTISPEGEGKYSITTTMYCFHDAYTINYNQDLKIYNQTEVELNLDEANAELGSNGMYLDWQEHIEGDHWIMTGTSGFVDNIAGNETYIELHIYPEEKADPKKGLPSGTYTFDKTKEPGTIAIGTVSDEGYVSGSVLYNAKGEVTSLLLSGELQVINNGDGLYSVVYNFEDQDSIYYYGRGYCSGVYESYPSQYTLSKANAIFVGDGGWFLEFTDMTKYSGLGITLRILVVGDSDIEFADGIPCEKFRFDSSGNPGTAMAGAYNGKGYYYSMVLAPVVNEKGQVEIDKEGNIMMGVLELLTGGEVEITKDKTTYTANVKVSDSAGNIHRGIFTGTIPAIDGSETEDEGEDEGGDEGGEGSEPTAVKSLGESAFEWSNFNKIDNAKKFVGNKSHNLNNRHPFFVK